MPHLSGLVLINQTGHLILKWFSLYWLICVTRSKSQHDQLFIFPKTHSLLEWRETDHENVIHSQTFYYRFCSVHCKLPKKVLKLHFILFVLWRQLPPASLVGMFTILTALLTPHSSLHSVHNPLPFHWLPCPIPGQMTVSRQKGSMQC